MSDFAPLAFFASNGRVRVDVAEPRTYCPATREATTVLTLSDADYPECRLQIKIYHREDGVQVTVHEGVVRPLTQAHLQPLRDDRGRFAPAEVERETVSAEVDPFE